MVDAALVELEGVLFDTRSVRLSSLRTALLTLGIGVALESEVIDGLPARAAAAESLTLGRVVHDDVLLDLVAHRAERTFSETLAEGGARLRGGAGLFVETAAASARLGVVTRLSRATVEALLRLAALDKVFTVMVCADDVLDGKPSPQGYELALERLHRQRPLVRTRALALEDGLLGIRAAHGAGIRCVAVGPLAPHAAMEADAYVESVAEHTVKSLDALSAPGQEHVQ